MTQDPQARPYTDAYPEPAVTQLPPGAVAVDDVLIVEEPLPYGEVAPVDEPSSADVAKDQATQVGQSAADAGKHVAGTAKDEAGNVAAEARTRAKDVLGQARTEARDQADTQKQRVTSGLQSISAELGSMADRSEQPGVATDLARQASQGASDVAAWLEKRDPNQILDDVRSFARRRPAAFLGIALAAGVVAGRLTRGLKDDSGEVSDTVQDGPYDTATTPYDPTTPQGTL